MKCCSNSGQLHETAPQSDRDLGLLAIGLWKCNKQLMCFHATMSGMIVPVWSKTTYDEVMLHCARIGFKP